MEVLEKISALLNKKIKEDKILTQKQLAEKMGVSPVSVNKWLNGGSIDLDKIPTLCKALNITPNELFDFDVNKEDILLLEIINKNPKLKAYVMSMKDE